MSVLAADMVEMTCETVRGGRSDDAIRDSDDAIRDHPEAVIAAAERRLFVEPVLINWRAYETIQ